MTSNKNYLAFLIASMLLLGMGLFFPGAGTDDAYYSLFPAWTLSEYGQILNYNGEVVEQSSSLLHVLTLGALHRVIGGDLIVMNTLLMLVSGIGTLGLTLLVGHELELKKTRLFWAPILLVLTGVYSFWVWGKLEVTLSTFCLTGLVYGGLIYLKRGSFWKFAVFLIPFLLVRPENGLVGMTVLGFLGLSILPLRNPAMAGTGEGVGENGTLTESPDGIVKEDPKQLLKKGLVLALSIIVAFGLLLLIRKWIFGHFFPLSVDAKTDGLEVAKIKTGIVNLFDTMVTHPTLLIMSGLAIGGLWKLRRELSGKILFAVLASQLAFNIVVGGDWMGNARFLVPIVPLLVISMISVFPNRKWYPAVLGICLLPGIWTAGGDSFSEPWATAKEIEGYTILESGNRTFLRDLPTAEAMANQIGQLYQQVQPVTILSRQGGLVMFKTCKEYMGKVHFTDLVGLTSSEFNDCAYARNRGTTQGGLNVSYAYLLENKDSFIDQCGFTLPHIVFDLDNAERDKEKLWEKEGYRLVYRQEGTLNPGQSWMPGYTVRANQFIMVRGDLLGNMPLMTELKQF